MCEEFLRKLTRWVDPKLEKYREKKPTKAAPPYVPKDLEDFIGVLQRTPKAILGTRDRSRIAAIMSFDERTVGELMTGKDKMVFVSSKEILGPLVLDKLYKSGFTNFPVVDTKEKVVGVIHTEALNTLEERKTEQADKYMNKSICYLHADDSLESVVKEIERTNSYYFLVRDASENLVGFFTVQMLLDYLLG